MANPAQYCFGRCGMGCGAIDIELPVCFAHDWCVCRFGATACAASVPSECSSEPENCASLLDAVIAVGEYVFAPLFNLIENTLDAISEFIGGVIELSVEVISDLVNGLVDAVSAFLDWVFGNSCGGEEQAQSCS